MHTHTLETKDVGCTRAGFIPLCPTHENHPFFFCFLSLELVYFLRKGVLSASYTDKRSSGLRSVSPNTRSHAPSSSIPLRSTPAWQPQHPSATIRRGDTQRSGGRAEREGNKQVLGVA
jgi:hypothetical protein